jgi:hypothetical protein
MDTNIFTTPTHTGNPLLGACFSLVSIVSASLCWVSLKDFQLVAAIIASIAATISAVFGAHHFYWSAKEKKDALKARKYQNP